MLELPLLRAIPQTRRLFGAMVRRIEVPPLPAAWQKLWRQTNRSEKRQAPETCLEDRLHERQIRFLR